MSRHFYHVPPVTDADGGTGPELDPAVSWVGNPCGCGEFLVLTDAPLPDTEPVALDALPGCCAGALGPGLLASWKVS